MKIFVLILAVFLIIPMTDQLYVTFENKNMLELESKNLNITFYKDSPTINVTYNGTSTIIGFTFLSVSTGNTYYFNNVNWSVWFNTSYYQGNVLNFTMKYVFENYSVCFNFIIPENFTAYSTSHGFSIPPGIKNAIIIENTISGVRTNSIALGETISTKNIPENLTGIEKLTPIESTPYSKINLNDSFSLYLINSNGSQFFMEKIKNTSQLLNVLPFSSGNYSYISYLSIPASLFVGETSMSLEYIYILFGSILGFIIILIGLYYIKKKSF